MANRMVGFRIVDRHPARPTISWACVPSLRNRGNMIELGSTLTLPLPLPLDSVHVCVCVCTCVCLCVCAKVWIPINKTTFLPAYDNTRRRKNGRDAHST